MSLMFVVLLISSSEFDFHKDKIKQKVNTAIFESIDLLHKNKDFHPKLQIQ